MSTHADRIREAERAELLAGEQYFRDKGSQHGQKRAAALKWLTRCISERLALRAATCPTCGGTGDGERSRYAGCPGIVTPPCPANCDNGRRRDA